MLGKASHETLGQYEWWHTAVGLFEQAVLVKTRMNVLP